MKKLITICLALLLCAPAYGTPIASADNTTAIAAMQVDVDSLLLLSNDVLALNKSGPGDVFYVDSNATGSGTGVDWTNAEVTIEAAIANCTAGAGDWIFAAPTHVETAATAFVDLDLTHITLWGLGIGSKMPTLSYDTSTDTFIIGATGDGVKVHGFKFIATVTAVANAIVVEAGCTDFVIEDCVFENETTTVDEFIDAILVSGTLSDRGIIRNNRFLGDIGANAGPQSSINFVDCDYLQIYGNEFSGDIAVAHIQNESTASNYITIRDNRIFCGFIGDGVTTLDTTPGISLVATTTGWIQDNFIVTNVATPDLSIVAADCYLDGNTYNGTQGSANAPAPVGLVAGKSYSLTMNMGAANDDDLFNIVGGPILITSLSFYCTTDVAAANTWTIKLDHVDKDVEFTTAVDVAAANDGDRIVFSAANPAVITILALTDNVGSGNPMIPWFCPVGMLEVVNDDSTQVGVFDVYITFIPLTGGITVTPQ